MLGAMLPATICAALVAGLALSGCQSQSPATPESAQAAGRSGTNVGSLSCTVAGGVGFVFGSSKDLTCLLTRTDGMAERYSGTIKRFGASGSPRKPTWFGWFSRRAASRPAG